MTVETYQHNSQPIQLITSTAHASAGTAMERAADFTTWAQKLQSAAAIAAEIANTDFVPAALRGKIPAVTAAIMAGSEMNLGPMASLMHVHVIDGRPALSAEMARSLVYSMGHQIRWVESTSQRCIIEGLRRGEKEWFRVAYTMDDAKRAGLDGRPNYRKHPRRMLAARASGELCRLHFSDALAGMPYVAEELEDDSDDGEITPATAGAATPKTVQRKTRQRPAAKPAARRDEPAQPAAGPPLPGEDGYDEPSAETTEPAVRPSTPAENRHMHALFREAEVTDRDDRLKLTSLLLGRDLDTSAGLTGVDAAAIIDALSELKNSGHPQGLPGAVNDLLNQAALAESETDTEQDPPAGEQ